MLENIKELSKEELLVILEEIVEVIEKKPEGNSIAMMLAYENVKRAVERGVK